jgi:DNA-binding NtrC family response regulator
METKTGKILVVDDDTDVLSAARLFLKRHFLHVDVESNPESIPFLINNTRYDVILLDMNFTKDIGSGNEGFYWLDRILAIDPAAVVVLITAYGDVEMAVRAIKDGATDFVLKPWENEKLLATLISAMRLRQSREETESLKAKQKGLNQAQTSYTPDIIGQSPAMMRVYEAIDRVAETDANVLILGENGTGKELIARALHRKSKRADEAFVSVDLGAISETLFESELFGHVKGSFTDAKEDRAGRFETASGGSIFLDEIGNLSLPLQAKLLTVLQSRTVTRVGSNKPKTIDIRLISATNMPVYEMVKGKTFRQDLLYRINTIEIHLPPLRERPEDLVPLADYYLQMYRKKYNRSVSSLSPALLKRMQKYHWPGNVRELQHAIERAVIMSQSNVLQPEDFFFSNGQDSPASDETALDAIPLDEMEKMLIRKALKKHNGNITEAAQELGLTRSSLYRRLEKYGM